MNEAGANSGERVCPGCDERKATSPGRKNDFELLSCRACKTLYSAGIADGKEEQEDYDSYYTDKNLTVPAFVNQRLDEIISTFAPYRQNNRLLDVGFGAGSFLEAAARGKWEPFGIEISQTATEHARARGFNVLCGQLDQAGYPDNYFDVVIASELLEHVLRPRLLLEGIARILRPGGLLWATTPHGRGLSARLLGVHWSAVSPPEHLQLFSNKSVQQLLAGAGFQRIRIATHGTNPCEIVHGIYRRMWAVSDPATPAPGGFNRVESSYQLNESLSRNHSGRMLKRIVNGLLNAGRMGDSLKIQAEK